MPGAAEELSSPELTLCADSYLVSVPPPCNRSGTYRTPVILPKSTGGRLHLNTHTPLTEWADYAMNQERAVSSSIYMATTGRGPKDL